MLPLNAGHSEVVEGTAGRLADTSTIRQPDTPDGVRGIESPKGGSMPTFRRTGNGEPGRCKAHERRQRVRFGAGRDGADGDHGNPAAFQIRHVDLPRQLRRLTADAS